MRWLRVAVPATVLAAWLASSFAQQSPSPPTPPPSTPAGQPPAGRPPPADEDKEPATPPANNDKDDEEVEVPTELQPDAAVTFPVDI